VPSLSGSNSVEQMPWVATVYYTGTGDEGNERTAGGKPNGEALTDNGWGLGGPTGMQGLN